MRGAAGAQLSVLDPYFNTLADGMLAWLDVWEQRNPGHTARPRPTRPPCAARRAPTRCCRQVGPGSGPREQAGRQAGRQAAIRCCACCGMREL